MTEARDNGTAPVIRFGRTEVVVVVGDPLDQGAAAVVFPANQRGVMGAIATPGLIGLRSLGGSDLERQAMAQAPLEMGTAIVTGAPGLESRGVEHVVHAVIRRALGEAARVENVRRAIGAALVAGDRVRARTLALPPLGLDSGTGRANPDPFLAALTDELVTTLRRSTLRYDRVTIACRFADHANAVSERLASARDRAWLHRQ